MEEGCCATNYVVLSSSSACGGCFTCVAYAQRTQPPVPRTRKLVPTPDAHECPGVPALDQVAKGGPFRALHLFLMDQLRFTTGE